MKKSLSIFVIIFTLAIFKIYFKTDDDDLFRDSLTYFPASGYDIVWRRSAS